MDAAPPISHQQYGVVGYTHAGGIDQPLTVIRKNHPAGLTTLVPHANYRGVYRAATTRAGALHTCEGQGGCINVLWPAPRRGAYHQGDATGGDWVGSLIPGMQDASGLLYKRNRYYNPATGQFTQTDPIGLAGGLNTYGFAAGDPVSYADPYGLRASGPCPPDCNIVDAILTTAGALVGGAIGGGGGFVAGASCGPAAAVCSPVFSGAGAAKGSAAGAAGVALSNGLRALGNLFARDGDAGGGGDEGESQGSSAGRMQRQVERGQAPRSIKRVDRGRSYREQDNVHFKDGNHALNRDGTWKHGGRDLTNAESEWLRSHGWGTP